MSYKQSFEEFSSEPKKYNCLMCYDLINIEDGSLFQFLSS